METALEKTLLYHQQGVSDSDWDDMDETLDIPFAFEEEYMRNRVKKRFIKKKQKHIYKKKLVTPHPSLLTPCWRRRSTNYRVSFNTNVIETIYEQTDVPGNNWVLDALWEKFRCMDISSSTPNGNP